jgi:streptogramin lyase
MYDSAGKRVRRLLSKTKDDADTMVTVDAKGQVYVLTAHDVVEHVDPFAKNPSVHVVGLPARVGGKDLVGLAVGKDGSLYLGDDMSNRISILTPEGNLKRAFRPAEGGEFYRGVATDRQGNLYIGVQSDGGADFVIQEFNASGHYLTSFLSLNSACLSIAISQTGDVYATDTEKVVFKFNSQGDLLAKWKMRAH